MDLDPKAELHMEDREYIIRNSDYRVTMIYEGCKWYWKVHFCSDVSGPFDTEREALKDATDAGYIENEEDGWEGG